MGADGKPKPFDQVIDEYPITSGPYTIASADSGRRIDFALDPNYWARDLNVRRGQFNFERIVYRLFRDRSISMEAFKAGEFEIIQEFTPQQYVRLHDGAKWRDGRIVKKNFEYGMGKGMQAYLLNLRRPIFQDARVREALDYSYDFEKINLYNQRRRSYSLFSNSDFAADGMPGPGELKLLEPFRAQLPPEVFGTSYQPPRTDTGPNALRENLKKARALLEEAGWKVAADGVLRNAKGEPFEFEYLEPESSNQFRTVIWQRNLAKLGINLKSRIVDFALYRKRLETFDFDTITIRTPDFALPSALDYQEIAGLQGGGRAGFQQLPGSQESGGRRDGGRDEQREDLRGAARCVPRTRPDRHVRTLPGAAALRAVVFGFLLEQVRHPQDLPQVLHDRRIQRLAGLGGDGLVEQGCGGEDEPGIASPEVLMRPPAC